jgi:hypothetical protein
MVDAGFTLLSLAIDVIHPENGILIRRRHFIFSFYISEYSLSLTTVFSLNMFSQSDDYCTEV